MKIYWKRYGLSHFWWFELGRAYQAVVLTARYGAISKALTAAYFRLSIDPFTLFKIAANINPSESHLRLYL